MRTRRGGFLQTTTNRICLNMGDNADISLSAILSRLPSQSPIPEELLLTLLTPLITPHKESRDHHLLINSTKITSTAQFLRNVLNLSTFADLRSLPMFLDWKLPSCLPMKRLLHWTLSKDYSRKRNINQNVVRQQQFNELDQYLSSPGAWLILGG